MAETTDRKRGGRPKKVENTAPIEEKSEDTVVETEALAEADAQIVDASPAPEKTFTEADVQMMIAEAVAKAIAENANASVKPTAPEDVVTILYLDECSPQSTLELPGYGTMRPYSYLEVPKREFGNKFMSALARKLLDKRKLIVMSGLTQSERERWNCDYKEGEILDEQTFDKMLDYPTPKLADIFDKLCAEHQKFVACRMITAKEKGDNRISLEKTKKINELSKKNNPNGMLKPVLEAFGAEISG